MSITLPTYGHYKPLAFKTIEFVRPKYFIRVYLWHSKRQLRQVANFSEVYRSRTMRRATAFTNVLNENATTNYFGDVHFCAGEITVDHVSHEVHHITTFWAFNNGHSMEPAVKDGIDYNELMAQLQGNFTRHIWRWLCKQKVRISL